MFPTALWTTIIALVVAVAALTVLALRRRPEQGWIAWGRQLLRRALAGAPGGGTGVIAELRDAADGETVSLGELLADAEEAPGYVTVPGPIEHRIEAIAEPIEVRFEALAERVAARRSAH